MFTGSLHPNIQDSDGRPKRDPQTILQILTDLLSATTHYEVIKFVVLVQEQQSQQDSKYLGMYVDCRQYRCSRSD